MTRSDPVRNGIVSSDQASTGENVAERHQGCVVRGLPEGDRIFLIDGPEKRWVRTPEVLERLGFTIADVVNLPDEEIALIDTGEPLDLSDPRFGGPQYDLAAGQYRSLAFREQPGGRFGWFRMAGTYVPPVFALLQDEEWDIIEAWYNDTESRHLAGESNVAFMNTVQGFIMGSRMAPIVELGVYAGFSTLLLGFMLRRMDMRNGLFSVEISDFSVEYVGRWIQRAGLEDFVTIYQGDSASESARSAALEHLGRSPQVIVLDSSHQYAHTVAELDSWFPVLQPNGFVFLHDADETVERFDGTGQGGVARAIDQWSEANPEARTIRIGPDPNQEEQVYVDACGLGIIQKNAMTLGRRRPLEA